MSGSVGPGEASAVDHQPSQATDSSPGAHEPAGSTSGTRAGVGRTLERLIASGPCPICGELRLGSFRYCRKCGLDYETAAHSGVMAPSRASDKNSASWTQHALLVATPVRRPWLAVKRAGPLSTGRYLALLAGTALAALLAMATASLAIPQAVQLPLATSMVFILPGFAVTCAVLPGQGLSPGERVFASLGTSLAIGICTAVLLGVSSIGLSRESFAFALGGSTLALSLVAMLRSLSGFRWRRGHDRRRSRKSAPGTVGS